ncbi:prolyl-tRNA synthetase associated domain-containing protein [Peptoniphilus mikwangii]|uniref:prolyl-tRNA synthetase associated domain-containing protein n=2 Tax=Peptoniphilus TaxID=162289 RepID=UPI000410B4D5|nr:prolyl-tRNA synthetase associated domain-containing protein [Peptoniphilus mikwangii]
MKEYEKVLQKLEELNINYKLVDHPPALTTEQADKYIEGIEGVRTKTLFLANKKNRAYYLIVMDDMKRVDMKILEELIETKGLHFCSEEKLMEKLMLPPGVVSIFGLLNNFEKDVNIILDEEIMNEKYMSFHVNDNTKTAFITTEDMCRFINECGFEYKIIKL